MQTKKCLTPTCAATIYPASGGKRAGKFVTTRCSVCRHTIARANDPERLAYHRIKAGAKSRRIPFTLTLPQFRLFCTQHTYMVGRGRSSTGFHLDRIDESRGYFLANLQVLTNAQNVGKANNWRAYQRRLVAWYEMGGTGPVPPFKPTSRVPTFEYYRGKCLAVYYVESIKPTPSHA